MTESKNRQQQESRVLVGKLLVMALAMFAFGFLLVPLYDAFCEVTGFGGKTNRVAATATEQAVVAEREITLEFVTTVNAYAPWEFESAVQSMTVSPGGMYEAVFIAANTSDQPRVAQAVPSVAPQQAAKYFKKLDCFCFTTQDFQGAEVKEMPVRFIIDSDLPEYIDTITLSYTFFDATRLTRDESAHSSQ